MAAANLAKQTARLSPSGFDEAAAVQLLVRLASG